MTLTSDVNQDPLRVIPVSLRILCLAIVLQADFAAHFFIGLLSCSALLLFEMLWRLWSAFNHTNFWLVWIFQHTFFPRSNIVHVTSLPFHILQVLAFWIFQLASLFFFFFSIPIHVTLLSEILQILAVSNLSTSLYFFFQKHSTWFFSFKPYIFWPFRMFLSTKSSRQVCGCVSPMLLFHTFLLSPEPPLVLCWDQICFVVCVYAFPSRTSSGECSMSRQTAWRRLPVELRVFEPCWWKCRTARTRRPTC